MGDRGRGFEERKEQAVIIHGIAEVEDGEWDFALKKDAGWNWRVRSKYA